MRELITRFQCLRFGIPYKEGLFIHPLASLQKEGRIEIAERVAFQSNTFLASRGNACVKIGEGCFLNAGTRIDSVMSIEIGSNVMTGPYVYITDFNHCYSNINVQIKNQGLLSKGGVVIGDGAWIGVHSTIIGPATIGKGSVIGANSVVVGDIPDYCIACGVPASIVKRYNKDRGIWERCK